MSITIHIPTPLRPYVDNQDVVELNETGPVQDVLASLANQNEGLKKNLYDGDGNLRRFINVYVNDEDIRYQNEGNPIVNDGDSISIVPSIAGG